MPRIDSSVEAIAAILDDFDVEFVEGDTVDVCEGCWLDNFDNLSCDEGNQVAHPDYDMWLGQNDPYTCAICDVVLEERFDK